MRKVWEVIQDLVYEDAFQFFGPLVALGLVYLAARVSQSAWLGVALFLLIAVSLYLSLLREHKNG